MIVIGLLWDIADLAVNVCGAIILGVAVIMFISAVFKRRIADCVNDLQKQHD